MTWWIGLDRLMFTEQAQRELPRMQRESPNSVHRLAPISYQRGSNKAMFVSVGYRLAVTEEQMETEDL